MGALALTAWTWAQETEPRDAPALGNGRWEIQYFYDRNDSSLTLTDLTFPSAQRGIAAGFIEKKVTNLVFGDHDKAIPVVLVTANGGATWDQVTVKETAQSLFFLNDTLGWLVSADGVWETTESGRSWKRISNLKNLEQVYFVSPSHGFACGNADRVLETQDGGFTWKPVAWERGKTPPAVGAVYSTIAFGDAQNGLIAGAVPPAEPIRQDLPVRLQRPQKELNIFLTTKDGGATWHRTGNPMFGELTRASLTRGGHGLGLLQYQQAYAWPSEVFTLNMGDDEANRSVFRNKARAITDILLKRDGLSYVAGYEPPGDIHPSPIPGKVRVLRSKDQTKWDEMPVDYRAVGREVWLAGPADGEPIWLATDTGMILKWTPHP